MAGKAKRILLQWNVVREIKEDEAALQAVHNDHGRMALNSVG
jgi:hypothetical protein